jgi:hypothetical protein
MKFIENIVRSVVNEVVDNTLSRLIKDQYTENMAAMIPVGRKVGFPNFMNTGSATSRKPHPFLAMGECIIQSGTFISHADT